jgi:putative acetyltransferase
MESRAQSIAVTRRNVQFALMIIRDEEPGDEAAIRKTIREAFESAEHSSGTEAQIVDRLRDAGALAVSLVALKDRAVVGHAAISPVSIGDAEGWYGLGPVAVRPGQQQSGIGSSLIHEALARLRRSGAAGCVVLGEPAFYGRFGFSHDPSVTYADVPAPYFQILSFGPDRPSGCVGYHPAFDS